MKRKLEYNATHMVQNIDPNVPMKAVQKLKELNNPHYVNVELNQDFPKTLETILEVPENFLDNENDPAVNVAEIDKEKEEQRKRDDEEIEKALEEESNRVDILNSVKEHQAEMEEITCVFRDNMDADVVENHTNKTIVKSRKKGAKEVEIAPGENKVIKLLLKIFDFT